MAVLSVFFCGFSFGVIESNLFFTAEGAEGAEE